MARATGYTGNPGSDSIDAVRFYCGDTDNTNLLLTDTEITFSSTQMSDPRLAAAMCLDALSAKYAQRADITVGEVSKSWGDRSQAFHDRAETLRNEAGKLAVPFFGGQSHTDKEALDADTDATQPPARIGQFDNPLSRQFDQQAPDPYDPVQ